MGTAHDEPVKLTRSLPFTPRRLHRLQAEPPPLPPKKDELRAENPWLIRSVDVAHVGAEVFGQGRPGEMVQGAVALGASVWGVNKLIHAETNLDRLDGIACLALAGESALAAAGHALPGVALGLGLVHGVGELVVGAADIRRGREEDDLRRTAAGAGQVLTGAGSLVAHLVPGGALIGHGMMVVGAVVRQGALG